MSHKATQSESEESISLNQLCIVAKYGTFFFFRSKPVDYLWEEYWCNIIKTKKKYNITVTVATFREIMSMIIKMTRCQTQFYSER